MRVWRAVRVDGEESTQEVQNDGNAGVRRRARSP